MDFTHAELEAFVVLAEELHFGRTAERLHLSQSRVSRLVGAFETKLGGKLFERTSRSVRVTPLGARLRDRLGPALVEVRSACEAARNDAQGKGGTLRVGFTFTSEGENLQRLVTGFEAANPTCRVSLHEVDLIAPNEALRHGRIDVLASWLFVDEPDLRVGPPIHHEPLYLIVAPNHPLAGRESVSVEDLAGLAFAAFEKIPAVMRHGFLPPTTPSGRPIPRTVELDTLSEVIAYVASGRIAHVTVASLRTKLNRPDVAWVPIHDQPPVPFGLIWCAAHDNARIQALVEHAASVAGR